MNELTTFLTMRTRLREFGESLSEEQLFQIPKGFQNNIAWNLGHIAVTQQVLCYKLSGLELVIDEGYLPSFSQGTSPADWAAPPDMGRVLPLLTELAERFVEDHRAGRFRSFTPYVTLAKVELRTLQEAVQFNQMHEGMHLGYALAQRRALGSAGAPGPSEPELEP